MTARIQNDELKEELAPEEEEKKEARDGGNNGGNGGGGVGGGGGDVDDGVDSFDDDLEAPIGGNDEGLIDDEVNDPSAMVGNVSNVIGNATFDADLSQMMNANRRSNAMARSPEGNVPGRGGVRVVGHSSTITAVKARHQAKR